MKLIRLTITSYSADRAITLVEAPNGVSILVDPEPGSLHSVAVGVKAIEVTSAQLLVLRAMLTDPRVVQLLGLDSRLIWIE